MPIKIPNELPAVKTLADENIFVMTETRAITQDIRPLKILLLNLMPKKVETETQFARLLGNSPLQVELDLIHTQSHKSKNTDKNHLLTFYDTFDDIKNKKYDGMIITGAPVELMEFEEVEYWDELCDIMKWSRSHVTSTLHICWAAQAGLYYHYGVKKHTLDKKIFGIYPHHADYKNAMLLRGFDDEFMVPQSRYTTVDREDIEKIDGLKILASSDETGVYAVSTHNGKQIFVTGHLEYDTDTIKNEYMRDKEKGLDTQLPKNYFKDDNPENEPVATWRAHANLLYSNWLNYFVYQTTPYDIQSIDE